MSQQTYIGLPVKDLAKATEFFTRLGFSYNPQALIAVGAISARAGCSTSNLDEPP